jgi:hypothetical protein
MSEITGSKDFVAYGDHVPRPPDPQPERVVMVAPDGRTVQVMAEDVVGFAERGFVLPRSPQGAEPEPQKAKRAKAPTTEEEAS